MLIINDSDFTSTSLDFENRRFKYRVAVRGLILRDNKILIQTIAPDKKGTFSCLPGGGVEQGEELEEALHREMKEEVGATVAVNRRLGPILEIQYRPYKDFGLVQLNYAFVCAAVTEGATLTLTKSEIEKGVSHEWTDIKHAKQKLATGPKDDYKYNFTKRRDSAFLSLIT